MPAVAAAARARLRRPALLLAALVVILDQLSKWWILAEVMNPPRELEVNGVFNVVLAWNRGISFSLFRSDSPLGPYLWAGLAAAVAVALALWLGRVNRTLPATAIGLVIGGAIGNAIDRLRFGAVVDFLDLHLGSYHWPAFNLADSAITVGVVLLLADGLFARNG
ncbi:MAG: signal peptidase II [Dongiaceae bacterium]